MTYVVTEACIKCKYTDCVEVCPVDCFYECENMLVIHPDECIDCGVCEPECPVDAIKPDTDRLCENWGESDREGRIDNDAAFSMSYIRGEDREQASFLPARIDDYVGAEAAVRVIDAFAEGLDVVGLDFVRAVPAATGRPGYDPRALLKLYV